MKTFRFEFRWDPDKAASNAVKHRFAFDVTMTVFRDPLAATVLDETHVADEERWITLRTCQNGSLALVVHTWRQMGADSALVRIISARKPTKLEAKQYREGRP